MYVRINRRNSILTGREQGPLPLLFEGISGEKKPVFSGTDSAPFVSGSVKQSNTIFFNKQTIKGVISF